VLDVLKGYLMRTKNLFLTLCLGGAVFAGAGIAWYYFRESSEPNKKPTIEVIPQTALVDEPVVITITNLPAHEPVVVEASCVDDNGATWVARATFAADGDGTVNVATQAPLAGSYTGVDPMGLFWSMQPTEKNALRFKVVHDTLPVQLSVFAHDKLLAQKTITRLLVAPDIARKEIRELGVVGTLFEHTDTQKRPGIMVISGSEGGMPETFARLLASHGYTVLALAHFAAPGVPDILKEIPLEYFQNALQWLKKQPSVDGDHLTLFGISRGGELALLAGATFPGEMQAVIAYVPGSLAYGSRGLNKSAWTYKNQPIAFMPMSDFSQEDMRRASREGNFPFHAGTREDPFLGTPIFLHGMRVFHDRREAAAIPVERIRCPLLLVSGDEDALWPSALHGKLVMERLEQKGSTIPRKHLHYPNAGHGFRYPYLPSVDRPAPFARGLWCRMGGTAEGNARAARESWREMLQFLKETMQK
jgi:dienelactone hydrolase